MIKMKKETLRKLLEFVKENCLCKTCKYACCYVLKKKCETCLTPCLHCDSYEPINRDD